MSHRILGEIESLLKAAQGTVFDAVHSTYANPFLPLPFLVTTPFSSAFLEIVTQSVLPVFENVSVYVDREWVTEITENILVSISAFSLASVICILFLKG